MKNLLVAILIATAFVSVAELTIDTQVVSAWGGGGQDGSGGEEGSYGGNGCGGCGSDPEPEPDPFPESPEDYCDKNPEQPNCNNGGGDVVKCDFLNGNPTSLPYGGGNVTLNWGTSYAYTTSINNGIGAVPPDGSKTVAVDKTTTFVLTAQGADPADDIAGAGIGSDSCSVTVTVDQPTPAPSCDSFTATPSTLQPGGGNVNLAWNTTNATEVKLDGVAVSADGSATRNVTTSKTFTLTVANSAGSASCNAPVTVLTDQGSLTCDDLVFNASDTLVTPGSDVTLSWVWTGNVSSGVVDQGIGAVNSGDTRVVTINDKTTYTTTISGNGKTVSCPLTIDIETTQTPICQGVNFSASDTSVEEGDNVTLDWSWTQSYDQVRITNGIGVVSNNDSQTVRIDDDESYTLRVTRGNTTKNCTSVSIDARSDNGGGGGGGSSSPRCQYFKASDDDVSAGERVVLSWETSRADEITLYEGTMRYGDDIYNTDDDDEVDEGEFVVRPTEDTTYTLHLERGSRNRTCKVDVEVDDNVVVLTSRNQDPRVAGIALTAVPYTGFEAGPTLTILFYILLALWGLFVAYTFTVKRDRVLGFSLAGAFPRKQSVTDVTTNETDEEEENSAAAAYVASTTAPVAAPANLPTGKAPILGYSNVVSKEATDIPEEDVEINDSLTDLENRAHAQHALLSSDAMRYLAERFSSEEQFDNLDTIIADAKKQYPSEDGWVVINLERVRTLLDDAAPTAALSSVPTNIGSLAEAIVTANATAALQLVGNRPMVALADTISDLDALYRQRMGGTATVSDLLASASAHLTDTQIRDAIAALNSAVDGTYTDEANAVKTAIMKAIAVIG